MGHDRIPVPALLGLAFFDAYRIGVRLGLEVVGRFPDGLDVEPDSPGIVVDQVPAPPDEIAVGRRLLLRVGRGGEAGDREPRDPVPLEHGGHGVLDEEFLIQPDDDIDPDLVPEPA